MIPFPAVTWQLTLTVVAASILAAVGLTVAAARFERPLNRACGTLFGALALYMLTAHLDAATAGQGAFWSAARNHAVLLLPLAAIHFLITYRVGKRSGVRPAARASPAVLMALFLVTQVWYALRVWPLTDYQYNAVRGMVWTAAEGLAFAVFLLVAAVFARDHARAPSATSGAALLLGSVAFALWPTYEVMRLLANWATNTALFPGFFLQPALRASTWTTIVSAAVPAAVSVYGLVVLGRTARQAPGAVAGPGVRNAVLAWLVALVAGVLTGLGTTTVMPSVPGVDAVLGNAARASFPALILYALAKYELFGIDAIVKRGIQRGVVAALLISTFFIISEGAERAIEDQTGSNILGILGASLLLFALAPLERLARRVSDTFFPHVDDSEAYRAQRSQDIYQAALEHAWADGTVTAKERRMLEALREKMGVSDLEAASIEHLVRGAQRRQHASSGEGSKAAAAVE